ncbi:mitotic deacetylase associated SANT domain protein a isoform X1 [Pangasianodon hypophthalmus]|uniref:mitotic deacetylase associated SANT domain protein a isoform X1 n=1 Tax=Pangasianodon hypophthalmus TaxID=310915 RepID=UPI00230700FB|nr:mitotic deacetylase associated SANT domain protein a isoform X1 [Pangasianodon hypophthalmus]
MSLSPHQRGNVNNLGKQNIEGIEELAQHSGEVFYNAGGPSLEQTNSSAGGRTDPSFDLQSSAIFKPDKGYQVWSHFQQSGPMKWVSQEPVHSSTWFPGLPNSTKLPQNFGPSLTGMEDARGHQALPKTNHDLDSLQQEKMSAGSSVPYAEPTQALAPGLEWDSHAMAAMHHPQFQAHQHGHKPGDPQYQPHAMRHSMPDSTLQPFQVAFGPNKQLQTSGFFQSFQGNSAPQNLGYSEPPKSQQQQQQQQQLLQLQQQQQQMQQMLQQQQQQRLLQIQQQYQHQQKMQEQLQQMQQQHQLHQMQNMLQPESCSSQPLQQDQRLARPPQQPDNSQVKASSCTLPHQRQDPSPQSPVNKDPGLGQAIQEMQETEGKPEALPRRSRRLSKDGISPPVNPPAKEPARNGGIAGVPGPSVGVIHSTQRRRRTSKEINLETLAQKASEMEFLPAKQRDESTSSRQTGMPPLVIPVSVPVRKNQVQVEQTGGWTREQRLPPESTQQSEHKPSVIVTRRRSLRASDSFNQEDAMEDGRSPDKIKRRPRPEPLVIPPPRPCTFIAPSVYSSISPFQSHLRSPIRLLDNPLTLPPYTPPPILSPVREGSGLYFSTFLSSIAAGNQGLPPPPTPKTASRSLLRSTSSDITPPMLPLIGEATPVSLEPRINIGSQYQAEIPELQVPSLVEQDQHKATLVWLPLPQAETSPSQDETVDNLMHLACSSVLHGGGTNVELMHHCLHENGGDVMKTLEVLLLKKPIFPKDHHLSNYHYAGSDCWTVDEKRYFNKGISAYRKDFFLVQKVVQSKTLAQCVEFYYTYKKQVKVGRSGTLIYGPPDPEERVPEIPQIKQEQPEAVEESKHKAEHEDAGSDHLRNVTKTLQVSENEGKVLVLSNPKVVSLDEVTALRQETRTPPFFAPKPRESAGRRSTPSNAPKSQGEPEGVFPCKKCSRVFYKVKSRSAHMKSHAEQEKKAAAQRQREEEERLAALARLKAAETERFEDDSEAEEYMIEPDNERDDDWR